MNFVFDPKLTSTLGFDVTYDVPVVYPAKETVLQVPYVGNNVDNNIYNANQWQLYLTRLTEQSTTLLNVGYDVPIVYPAVEVASQSTYIGANEDNNPYNANQWTNYMLRSSGSTVIDTQWDSQVATVIVAPRRNSVEQLTDLVYTNPFVGTSFSSGIVVNLASGWVNIIADDVRWVLPATLPDERLTNLGYTSTSRAVSSSTEATVKQVSGQTITTSNEVQWVLPDEERTLLTRPMISFDGSEELIVVREPIQYTVPVLYGNYVRVLTLPSSSAYKVSNVQNAPLGFGVLSNGYVVGGQINFVEPALITVFFDNDTSIKLNLVPYFFERIDNV